MPVKLTVDGPAAVPCCRRCDNVMDEEADSPNPRGYVLFKCPTCERRMGIAVVAIAAGNG